MGQERAIFFAFLFEDTLTIVQVYLTTVGALLCNTPPPLRKYAGRVYETAGHDNQVIPMDSQLFSFVTNRVFFFLRLLDATLSICFENY